MSWQLAAPWLKPCHKTNWREKHYKGSNTPNGSNFALLVSSLDELLTCHTQSSLTCDYYAALDARRRARLDFTTACASTPRSNLTCSFPSRIFVPACIAALQCNPPNWIHLNVYFRSRKNLPAVPVVLRVTNFCALLIVGELFTVDHEVLVTTLVASST